LKKLQWRCKRAKQSRWPRSKGKSYYENC